MPDNCPQLPKCCNTDPYAYEITDNIPVYWNTEQTASCPEGSTGSEVTIPAHTYYSYASQANADALALQAAEASLVCAWWNTEQTAECPEGYTGEPVTIPAHTFSSTISQEDSDSIALLAAESALSCQRDTPFDPCEGSSNWYPESSSVPYTNSGSSVSGFSTLHGDALVVDTGELTTTTSTQPLDWATTLLPPVVSGDFIASFEIQAGAAAARGFSIGIADQDAKRALFGTWQTGHYDLCMSCDLTSDVALYDTGYAPNALITESGSPSDPPAYDKISLERSGTIITMKLNDLYPISYDYGDAFTGKVFLMVNGTAGISWRIRNILVTQA